MNRNLIFLFIGLFIWGVGEGMFFIFNPLYLQSLGASPLVIGGILGGFGSIMAVAHIPAGWVADKFGRRPVIRVAWLIGILAAVFMGLAKDLNLFVVGLLLYGLTGFVSAPLSSYVTAARGTLTTSRALSLTSFTFSSGMFVGPLIGGYLGDLMGLQVIYQIASVLFAISLIFIYLLKRQPIDEHDLAAPPPLLLQNKRFTGFLMLSFAVTFALFIAQPFTPNFLQNERGLNLSEIGQISSVGALGNGILILIFGGLASPRLGYLLAQACVALFAVLVWQGESHWVFALAYFLLGGFRAARSLGVAQVKELIHPSQMGLAYGFMETVNTIPLIVGPPLAGLIYQKDPLIIYPLAIGLIIFTILMTYFFRPSKVETPVAI